MNTASSGSDWAGQPMTAAAISLSTVFEEPEDPSNRSFFSEIISSVSDVKFSHSGRYMLTRDYLTVKVWDLNMEARPIETYQVCVEVWWPQGPPCGVRSPRDDHTHTFLVQPTGLPSHRGFLWCSVDETAESLWGS